MGQPPPRPCQQQGSSRPGPLIKARYSSRPGATYLVYHYPLSPPRPHPLLSLFLPPCSHPLFLPRQPLRACSSKPCPAVSSSLLLSDCCECRHALSLGPPRRSSSEPYIGASQQTVCLRATDRLQRFCSPRQPWCRMADDFRRSREDPSREGPETAPLPPPSATQQQAKPRQRISIACSYCRKKKVAQYCCISACFGNASADLTTRQIRCSGSTTNGKCTNCDNLRINCIFQPVVSYLVSLVPDGAPPGIYEAYGQPPPPNHPLHDDPPRRPPVSINNSATPPAAGYAQYQQSPYDRDRPPSPIPNCPPRPMAQQLQPRASQVALSQGLPQPPPPSSQFPPQLAAAAAASDERLPAIPGQLFSTPFDELFSGPAVGQQN